MDDVEVANKLFLVLTLLSDAVVVSAVLLAIGGLGSDRLRQARQRVASRLGPRAVPMAATVGAVTTLGSLYYSEVQGYVPCELCWYQRICMYPLAALLVVAALRRDRSIYWYAAPFVAIGAPLALYHWLVERVPALAESTSCSALVPCSVPYFEEIGFVTLAFMDLSAFLLIAVLLVCGFGARGSATSPATDGIGVPAREPVVSR